MVDHKDGDDKNENNVIPFPAKRKNRSSKQRKPTLFWEGDLRATLGGAAVLALLLAVSIINNQTLHKNNNVVINDVDGSKRTIASTQESNRDLELELDQIRKLASKNSDEGSLLGRSPSAEEKLRFGDLSGLYAFNYNNGKITKIRYAASKEQPKYLNNLEDFLLKNKNIISIKFSTVKQSTTKVIDDNKKIESFELFNENKQQVGTVEFELDQHGRFIAMKVLSSKE